MMGRIITNPLMQTPPETGHLDLSRIAQDLQIRKVQVEAVVHLLDEGNTIPFITRYRKERTGGLDEDVLRTIQDRVALLRQLGERKQTILKSIEGQEKLTDELRQAILAADNPKRLEDLYLPFKPKKRTLATAAREKGLEQFALAIWNSDPIVANLQEFATSMINPEKELNTPEEILTGTGHILAEMIAESADVRGGVRMVLWDTGKLCSTKNEKLAEGQGLDYKDYFQFEEPIRQIPPHRILAINRGEKEHALTLKLLWDEQVGLRVAQERLPLPLPTREIPESTGEPGTEETSKSPLPPMTHRELVAARTEALRVHPHGEFLKQVASDSLTRLIFPSLEREIRRELTQRAEGHAVEVFARNLRSKLLAAPLRGKRVLAIDPGFRTGCKLAILNEVGDLLEEGVMFPHQPQNRKIEARYQLEQLVRKHQVDVIAIGNGTACRDTEEHVSDLIAVLDARRTGTPLPHDHILQPYPVSQPHKSRNKKNSSSREAVPEKPPETPEASTPATSELPGSESPNPIVQPEIVSNPVPPPESTAVATPPDSGSAEVVVSEEKPTEVVPPPPPGPSPQEILAQLPESRPELAYVIVNEAGASVYSTSPLGREEFPNLDATSRGTISIGRRLQDPLAELVKIDPQHVGVGLYQHDLKTNQLKESLEGVIESCVNTVGVDLNTASVPLLRHVSGLNALVAYDLVEYRKNHGAFKNRDQLKQVNGIGEQRYIQAAGFLKIQNSENPLDNTWIHPESYPVTTQILQDLGFSPEALTKPDSLEELRKKIGTVNPEELSTRLGIGLPTIKDILESLSRPGRDPREDLPPPIFKKNVLKLEDLNPGMELKGSVLNVVDFGAFVDIGLKDSGLVHISQMANRYVKSPYEVIAVGDVVNVWVMTVDKERHRVSLTMIQPGTERKPPERRPQGGPPRERREGTNSGPGNSRREGQPHGHHKRAPGPGGNRQGGGQPSGGVPVRTEEGIAASPGGGPRRQGGNQRREGGPGGAHQSQGNRPAGRRLPPRGQSAQASSLQKGKGPGQSNSGTQNQPTEGQPQAEGVVNPAGASDTPVPKSNVPNRKQPRKQPTQANLSQSALAGASPLKTFSELAAFLKAKTKQDDPAPPDNTDQKSDVPDQTPPSPS